MIMCPLVKMNDYICVAEYEWFGNLMNVVGPDGGFECFYGVNRNSISTRLLIKINRVLMRGGRKFKAAYEV
jgi:hypothetical protein